MTHENPISGIPDPNYLASITDLYEITMGAAWFQDGMSEKRASFNLFVRNLPPTRKYLVTAGLEQAIHYLQHMRFSPEDIRFLRDLPRFREANLRAEFWERLENLRFTGDMWAMPEGTLAFGQEPILSLTGPLIEVQLAETFLLTTINDQTMIASKAARIVDAAKGKPVVEFGLRRAHGPQAGIYASRAAFIGGCAGTSDVFAMQAFGIPDSGTMAHSFVLSYPDEKAAFESYAKTFPKSTIALVDTFDVVQGTINAEEELGAYLSGVRTDSKSVEEMAEDCKKIRTILDCRKIKTLLETPGRQDVKIIVSNDLNEEKIAKLLELGAPIDVFGVGTDLVVSRDAPALSGVYKLVEIENEPKMKLSHDKITYPGRQQVWRTPEMDVIGVHDEDRLSSGISEPLLVQHMKDGKLIRLLDSLPDIQKRARTGIESLPENVRNGTETFPVSPSGRLATLTMNLKAIIEARSKRQ